MSCSRFIFLDTSVFEALGYDFEKPAARAFVEAATQTGAALVPSKGDCLKTDPIVIQNRPDKRP